MVLPSNTNQKTAFFDKTLTLHVSSIFYFIFIFFCTILIGFLSLELYLEKQKLEYKRYGHRPGAGVH